MTDPACHAGPRPAYQLQMIWHDLIAVGATVAALAALVIHALWRGADGDDAG